LRPGADGKRRGGEPLVGTPEHAYLCFMRTNMDYLLLGNFLLEKKD